MSSDEAQLRGRFTDIKMEEEEVNSNHWAAAAASNFWIAGMEWTEQVPPINRNKAQWRDWIRQEEEDDDLLGRSETGNDTGSCWSALELLPVSRTNDH